MRLTKNTARLDVGQQMLEVAHTLRKRLHFTKALVHLLKPVGHLFKAFTQTCLQRRLKLFVHGTAHLVKLGGIGQL